MKTSTERAAREFMLSKLEPPIQHETLYHEYYEWMADFARQQNEELTARVAELQQQVERLTEERNGLMAGCKQMEQYVIDTREALKLRDCVECRVCGFEISPFDPAEGFCWNCHKYLTLARTALKDD